MNYNAIILEILTALLGIVVLSSGLLLSQEKKERAGYIAVFGTLAILVISFISCGTGIAFSKGLYTVDQLAVFAKQLFLLTGFFVLLISLSYVKKLSDSVTEFYAIQIFAMLGMMLLASANDFITLYIGLELMSISFIILTAYDKRNRKSTEAGIKYVLLSAISSAVLLYGLSLFYGFTGALSFEGVAGVLSTGFDQPLVIIASIMVLVGFGFKISAAPFHMWAPDIYEGAPTPITAFLAIGSKAAAFVMTLRFFIMVLPSVHGGLIGLLLALAVLSMVVGNVVAIPQTNLKRLLAYSGIAQAGYILLGLIAFTTKGSYAMLYYLFLYLFATIGAFAALTAFTLATGKEEISDLKGLWKRSPLITATILVALLSMAGIPPAAGFVGKFFLLSEVVGQGYLWLAIVTMVMSVVSAYYYIVVIRAMLLGDSEDNTPIKSDLGLKLTMIVCTGMTLVLGIYPGKISEWIMNIAQNLIK